ncbi:MAG: TetR/AcrR family transcriptional regulator [Reyranellaceae bacterium]
MSKSARLAAAAPDPGEGDTRARILDIGERLLLERGYAGFSYQDIAEAVGIRKASIHHHFPSKEDLGRAIVERTRLRLNDGRGPVAEDGEQAKRQFERFLRFFERLSEEGSRLCIGGRLSADFAVLPQPVRDPFRAFMAEHAAWLEELCRIGQKTGAFRKDMPPREQALVLRASVQGAVQLARAGGDPELYRSVARVMRRQILA